MGFGVKLLYFPGANYLASASASKPAKWEAKQDPLPGRESPRVLTHRQHWQPCRLSRKCPETGEGMAPSRAGQMKLSPPTETSRRQKKKARKENGARGHCFENTFCLFLTVYTWGHGYSLTIIISQCMWSFHNVRQLCWHPKFIQSYMVIISQKNWKKSYLKFF